MDNRVLIVENSREISSAIESSSDHCFVCERVTDGWEAIERLETEHYDAIVIDSSLPRHSGFGVLTYLREEGSDLDRVILVASDGDEVRRRVDDQRVRVVDRAGAIDALVAMEKLT